MNSGNDKTKDKRMSSLISAVEKNAARPNKEFLEKLQEISTAEFLASSSNDTKNSKNTFPIWRIIMKSNITKFATVAVITVALILGLKTIFFSTKPIYAFEQTVEAYSGLRYIHVENLSPPASEPQNTWLEFDERGELIKLRVEEGKDDTFRIMVWANDTLKWWSPSNNEYVLMNESDGIRNEIDRARMAIDPKYAVQNLYEQILEGKIDNIEIEQPNFEEKFIKLTAYQTISQEDSLKSCQVKYVLLIDPDTKLASKIEEYISKNGNDELQSSRLFLEYNEPIDPEMFILNMPEKSNVDDRTIGIGMPQGNMTDSQAAAEVVRQYIKALIADDYKKASALYNGQVADELRTRIESLKIKYIRLISVGEPILKSERTPRSFGVPFAFVIETSDGKREIAGPYGGLPLTPENEANLDLSTHRQAIVRPVVDQPDRWIITGGI